MSTTVLSGLLAGAGIGTGLAALVLFTRGVDVDPGRPPTRWQQLAGRVRERATLRRAALALAAAAAVGLLTRWPVLALATAGLVACWPLLFGGGRAATEAIERLEALAAWTESLRDTIAGAAGLEQAVPASLSAAQPPIRRQLEGLVGRLRAREALPAALEQFAAELDDGSADVVLAALILNARLRGPGLADTLTAIANSAREELNLRRHVEAQRQATRRNVRIVLGIFAGMAILLLTANRPFLAPYGTPAGQVFLGLLCAGLAACLASLARLSAGEPVPRFLIDPDTAAVARWRG